MTTAESELETIENSRGEGVCAWNAMVLGHPRKKKKCQASIESWVSVDLGLVFVVRDRNAGDREKSRKKREQGGIYTDAV